MMVIKLIILIVLSSILHCKQQVKSQTSTEPTKIPKILWVYWDSGYESANTFTKLCINNMDYYTKLSGWDFRFLTKENFTNFISQKGQKRVQDMIAKSKYQITVQRISDIYRFSLLYQNGGMWLDANSFFINNLTWIQNIEKELSPYNKISNDPDLITFTYNSLFGGNKTRVIDQNTGEQIYLFPGIQCWCMIAKPFSRYLNDILENLIHSLTVSRAELDQQNKQLGILYSQQIDPYFLTANYQHQTVLQRKQKEIDLHPQNFTTKYSIDYYKIWNIDALSSAFAIEQFNDWKIGPIAETLFYDSIESFSQIHKTQKYLVKFTGHFYPQLNDLLPHVQILTCLKVMEKLPKDSITYKYLLQPSLSMPIVQSIVAANNDQSPSHQCRLLSDNQYNKIILLATAIVILFIAINCLIFWLIRSGEQAKQQFIQIQNNDQ